LVYVQTSGRNTFVWTPFDPCCPQTRVCLTNISHPIVIKFDNTTGVHAIEGDEDGGRIMVGPITAKGISGRGGLCNYCGVELHCGAHDQQLCEYDDDYATSKGKGKGKEPGLLTQIEQSLQRGTGASFLYAQQHASTQITLMPRSDRGIRLVSYRQGVPHGSWSFTPKRLQIAFNCRADPLRVRGHTFLKTGVDEWTLIDAGDNVVQGEWAVTLKAL
jgi:hypothetical protein